MHLSDRKERDKQIRQDDILRAAERIFARRGYYKATIQDIAGEAQYAVGTLYLYFKDKQSLYLTLIEKKFSDLISIVKNKVDGTKDIKGKIEVLIEEQLSYFEENQDFFRIYFSERGGLRWTIKDRISQSAVEKFMRYLDYIATLIKKAQEKNLIRMDLEPRRVAYILASMLNAVILPWLKRESSKKGGLKNMSAFVMDVFLNGVAKK